MSKKAREQKRRARAWYRYYENLIAAERTKIAAYEQLAKVNTAYVAILLDKLGATKDHAVTITHKEITEAMKKYEARASTIDVGFSLYCEVIAEE